MRHTSRAARRWIGVLLASALAMAGAVFGTTQPAAAAVNAASVYYWNDTLLEVFRRQGGGPGPLARGAAMMHGAIFDVANSSQWSRQGLIGQGFDRAFGLFVPDPLVNDELAAGIAARDALIDAFPAHRTYIEQRYTQRYGTASQAAATALAADVLRVMRSNRANDGSGAAQTYTPGTVPGAWRPTGCGAAVDPHWGRVRPFTMSSSNQFRRPFPGGFGTYPTLLASSLYTTQFNEVKSLGSATSTARTADQTRAAFFWANDANGTYKPPGQLLAHTRAAVQTRITNPIALSRLFALVSFAMADATITAWDHKYETPLDLWRPITAIREAASDNNPNTAPDTGWTPLGATPCFPAWTSGHATLAGAWAGVMNSLVGTSVSFTGGTDDPNAAGVTRTFSNFNQAAVENARSRIWLGVHYQFDADDGRASGASVASTAMVQRMRALNCPTPCY